MDSNERPSTAKNKYINFKEKVYIKKKIAMGGKYLGKKGWKFWERMVSIFNRVDRVDITKKVEFKQRFEGRERVRFFWKETTRTEQPVKRP